MRGGPALLGRVGEFVDGGMGLCILGAGTGGWVANQ